MRRRHCCSLACCWRVPALAETQAAVADPGSAQDQPAAARPQPYPDDVRQGHSLEGREWRAERGAVRRSQQAGHLWRADQVGAGAQFPAPFPFHRSLYLCRVGYLVGVVSSTHYDPSKMYPVPAGTFVTDIKNTIHWDGAKAETGPAILLLVGEGPMVSDPLCAQGPEQGARRPGLRAAASKMI